MKYRGKQIYYPTGIISLVLLPILCIWHLKEKGAFKKQTAIEINWYYDYGHCKSFNPYSLEYLAKKCNVNIILNGNENQIQLNKAITELRSLPITNKGVHFSVDSIQTFGELINMINICKNENQYKIIGIKNEIWAFNFDRDSMEAKCFPRRVCGGTHDLRYPNTNIESIDYLKPLKDLLPTFWMPLILWVYMGWFSIVKFMSRT